MGFARLRRAHPSYSSLLQGFDHGAAEGGGGFGDVDAG